VAQNIVIAIDPGREKCGIAVVHKEQGVIYKTIAATADLPGVVTILATTHNVFTAVIGDRTTSHTAQATLTGIKVNGQEITVIPVNEHRSTDEARKRYWVEHPPKGIKRLLPTTMQVPPGPVDDYVAVILAERYFVGR
jgi:RNase H-fold protein (predicted Holliday junction resolvase)